MPKAPLMIVTGDKELDRAFGRLPRTIQGKILRPAMRAGMKVVAERARAEAPVLSGATKRAIKVRVPKKKKRGSVAMQVVIKGAEDLYRRSRSGKYYFIPALAEYGHKGTPPDHFMHRAYKGAGDEATDVTMQRIRDGIEAAARRGGR